MPIDKVAGSLSRVVVKEKIRLTSSPDGRHLGLTSRLFYDRNFVLFRQAAGERVQLLCRGIDYELVFKLPGYRSINKQYSAYVGVQIFLPEPDVEYYVTYRSLGESCGFDSEQVRIFFENHHAYDFVSFFCLTLANGGAPTEQDLNSAATQLVGGVTPYSSTIGVLEQNAEENSYAAQLLVVEEGGVSAGVSSINGLTGAVELTISDILMAGTAASMDADDLATAQQGTKADSALQPAQADARYVRSVNGVTPDAQGNVVVAGGGSGGGQNDVIYNGGTF